MTSLPKQWQISDLRETKQIVYHSKDIDQSYTKRAFYRIWATVSKGIGIFVKFWLFFAMPGHQIWSCHVTQDANFELFLFCPNSTFNIRKSQKISGGKALYFRSYQQKTLPGGGGGGQPQENTKCGFWCKPAAFMNHSWSK